MGSDLKLGLLIGINYKGTSAKLRGCEQDVLATRDLLTTHFGFISSNVRVMTESQAAAESGKDRSASRNLPTKSNILAALESLAARTRSEPVSQVWISYSGHGHFVRDRSGDEMDGKDEVIVPLDFRRKGFIVDDHLHRILSTFSPSTSIVFIVDACHSGSMLDLPFAFNPRKSTSVKQSLRKNLIRAKVISLTGCTDAQKSADVFNINRNRKHSGAMTSAMLHVLASNNYNISCKNLILQINQFLTNKRLPQTPQLCSTEPIKSNTMFCVK